MVTIEFSADISGYDRLLIVDVALVDKGGELALVDLEHGYVLKHWEREEFPLFFQSIRINFKKRDLEIAE